MSRDMGKASISPAHWHLAEKNPPSLAGLVFEQADSLPPSSAKDRLRGPWRRSNDC